MLSVVLEEVLRVLFRSFQIVHDFRQGEKVVIIVLQPWFLEVSLLIYQWCQWCYWVVLFGVWLKLLAVLF